MDDSPALTSGAQTKNEDDITTLSATMLHNLLILWRVRPPCRQFQSDPVYMSEQLENEPRSRLSLDPGSIVQSTTTIQPMQHTTTVHTSTNVMHTEYWIHKIYSVKTITYYRKHVGECTDRI